MDLLNEAKELTAEMTPFQILLEAGRAERDCRNLKQRIKDTCHITAVDYEKLKGNPNAVGDLGLKMTIRKQRLEAELLEAKKRASCLRYAAQYVLLDYVYPVSEPLQQTGRLFAAGYTPAEIEIMTKRPASKTAAQFEAIKNLVQGRDRLDSARY